MGIEDFDYDPEDVALRCGEDEVTPQLYGMHYTGPNEAGMVSWGQVVGYGLVEEEYNIPLTAEEDDATIREGDACLTCPLRSTSLDPSRRMSIINEIDEGNSPSGISKGATSTNNYGKGYSREFTILVRACKLARKNSTCENL